MNYGLLKELMNYGGKEKCLYQKENLKKYMVKKLTQNKSEQDADELSEKQDKQEEVKLK